MVHADPTSYLPLPQAQFHVLVALTDGERHGYAIMQAVEESSGGVVRMGPATLYGTLKRLVDHGFAGWGGSALLSDPSWPFAIAMRSPDAAFFQLYSPETGGIFVAEPVSHANAALNAPEEQWVELGIKVLEPGERMALTMRIDLN